MFEQVSAYMRMYNICVNAHVKMSVCVFTGK